MIFILKKTILIWILMTTGSGLWWLTVRLPILQHSNSSVTAVGVCLPKAKSGNKKQSRYKPGVVQRAPGS